MTKYRWKKFFSPEDYSILKYKHLKREDYRQFIIKINERKAKQEIVLNKEGYEMPLNFGLIKILKKFMPKGVNVMYKKTKEFNTHSLGYVYSPKVFKRRRTVYYNSKYDTSTNRGGHVKVDHHFFRFIPHRANIKRAISPIVRKQILDYDEA